MFPAHLNGSDPGAKIYGAQRIPDPPDHSAFNRGGGGGPESVITWVLIWTAQGGALKSTVHIGFRTPPSVLPLMEGGGGGVRNEY
jgi:hypothetical protein